MANEEHVAWLNQGVITWKRWREANPNITPDLSWVDLSELRRFKADFARARLTGARLTGADLPRADLSEADLTRAHLTGARLLRADLTRAHLIEADLRGADLSEADFTGANLSGADLTGARLLRADLTRAHLVRADLTRVDLSGARLLRANLSGADLSEADLTGAHLSGAEIGWTTVGDVDLSVVHGLESVKHEGPSTIGTDTLYRSHGNIPKVFLQGAGVPDDMITYMQSFVGRPAVKVERFEFYSCFISYSHADKSFARRLHDQLQGRGIRCWLDEHQMLLGDDIYEQIDRGIRFWDKVLLCCSQASLTSWWVDNEIGIALSKEQQLMKG